MINYFEEYDLSVFTNRKKLYAQLLKQREKWLMYWNDRDPVIHNRAEEKLRMMDEALALFSDPVRFRQYRQSLFEREAEEEEP